MPDNAKRPGDVGLHMEAREVHYKTFQKQVRAFFELVEEVTTSVTGEKGTVSWGVEVAEGSMNIGAAGRVVKAAASTVIIAAAIANGLRALEAGESRPPHFSDRALEQAKILATFQSESASNPRRVSVYTKTTDVPLTANARQSVEKMLEIKLSAYGTREGMLETASEHMGVRCTLYDRLTGEGIECVFPEEMKEKMWAAGGRRVSVRGTIRYRVSGAAARIDADDIRVIGEGPLPSIEDVRGILGE